MSLNMQAVLRSSIFLLVLSLTGWDASAFSKFAVYKDIDIGVARGFKCAEDLDIIVAAPSASTFEGNQVQLQKAVGGTRKALEYECGEIPLRSIGVTGTVQGREVYSGYSSESTSWVLQGDPPDTPKDHRRGNYPIIGISIGDYVSAGESVGAIVSEVVRPFLHYDSLHPGDVILLVGEHDVFGPDDAVTAIQAALARGNRTEFQVLRNGEIQSLTIEGTVQRKVAATALESTEVCYTRLHSDPLDPNGVVDVPLGYVFDLLSSGREAARDALISVVGNEKPGKKETFSSSAWCDDGRRFLTPVGFLAEPYWDRVFRQLSRLQSEEAYRGPKGDLLAFNTEDNSYGSVALGYSDNAFNQDGVVQYSLYNPPEYYEAPVKIEPDYPEVETKDSSQGSPSDTGTSGGAAFIYHLFNGIVMDFGDELLCKVGGKANYDACFEQKNSAISEEAQAHPIAASIGGIIGYMFSPVAILLFSVFHVWEPKKGEHVQKHVIIEGGEGLVSAIGSYYAAVSSFETMVIPILVGVGVGFVKGQFHEFLEWYKENEKEIVSTFWMFVLLAVGGLILYFWASSSSANTGYALKEAFGQAVSGRVAGQVDDAMSGAARQIDNAAGVSARESAEKAAREATERANREALIESEKRQTTEAVQRKEITEQASKQQTQRATDLKQLREEAQQRAAKTTDKAGAAGRASEQGGKTPDVAEIKKGITENAPANVKSEAGAAVKKVEEQAGAARKAELDKQNQTGFETRKQQDAAAQQKKAQNEARQVERTRQDDEAFKNKQAQIKRNFDKNRLNKEELLKSKAVDLKNASNLKMAREAAAHAKNNVNKWNPKDIHLESGFQKSKARFNTDDKDKVRAMVKDALQSNSPRYMNNPSDSNGTSFRVIADMKRPVGTKGQTKIRVAVGMDGVILNAFPVREF